jgi:hypothetical protein
VFGPYVGPDETLSLNLSTGVVFEPGESICLVIGGAGAGEGLTYTLVGYTAPSFNGP